MRVFLRDLGEDDAPALADLFAQNQSFLRPLEPRRPDDYFTPDGARRVITEDRIGRENDSAYALGVFELETERLVGRIALSNIVRRSWQSATLGYFVDELHNNKGYASEAVALALDIAFETLRLHRVQAAVMPRNPASARVLIKAGFRLEGYAPRYLEIDGRWEDHDLYAATVEDWKEQESEAGRVAK